MQYTTFKDVPESQVAEWKAKHKVYIVEIPVDEDDVNAPRASFYLRPMSVAQQAAIGQLAKQKGVDIREVQKTLLKTIVLAGDMEYLDYDAEDSRIIDELTEAYQRIREKKTATLKSV